MGDLYDRQAVRLVELMEKRHNRLTRQRIELGGPLVGDDAARLERQHASDRQPLRCPPESWCGGSSRSSVMPVAASADATRSRMSAAA